MKEDVRRWLLLSGVWVLTQLIQNATGNVLSASSVCSTCCAHKPDFDATEHKIPPRWNVISRRGDDIAFVPARSADQLLLFTPPFTKVHIDFWKKKMASLLVKLAPIQSVLRGPPPQLLFWYEEVQ